MKISLSLRGHVLWAFESLRRHSLVSKQANSRVNRICFDSVACHQRFYETNEVIFTRAQTPPLYPNCSTGRSNILYLAIRDAVPKLKEKCTVRLHGRRRHLPASDAKHNLHPLVHVEARRDHGHDFHVPNAQSDVESADSICSVYVL